ncbi:MAG: nucleoside triphosphate pyrophosphohydrolase [bacterium]|nr:nucleoside triphosphate pyrophosphohydrolase [bacterium]
MSKITVVGLGPGDVDDLTRKAWRVLKNASTVYLRTAQHGCVACLPQSDTTYHSFDAVYETVETFEDVYAEIVQRLLEAARSGDVVYAVPGDPLVGESTVLQLLNKAKAEGIEVEIVSGVSFVEPTLALVGVDAMNGLQLLDGLDIAAMHHPPINPDYPALIGQVYSRDVASNVKLTLMNQYPDGFPVVLVHSAGTEEAVAEHLPLHQIDRSQHIQHTTALYLPALGDKSSFEEFQEIIAHLRAPEGCPWDREQTHDSLRPFLLEEAYEVLEAIENDDPQHLAEELGDLLLQIVLHTQIAIDDGEFYMSDVVRHVNHKMIRRHPHVWGTVEVNGNSEKVVANWDALKKQEQAAKGERRESALDGIPKALPALKQAHEVQRKAAKVGFDWDNRADVKAKIAEEIAEIEDAQDDPDQMTKEMGDLLFSVVNWARWLKIDPELALRDANARFSRRFRYIEKALGAQGKSPTDSTLSEMDTLWNEAKRQGL